MIARTLAGALMAVASTLAHAQALPTVPSSTSIEALMEAQRSRAATAIEDASRSTLMPKRAPEVDMDRAVQMGGADPLAIAKQYPKLAIGPSFERDTERNSSLGLGVGLELPLLDRNQGEIAHKRAARERVRAEYTAMLHAALAQAFAARAQLRRARAEVEQQQSVVAPLLERADALLEAAFRAGELTLSEWLAARARSLQAKQDLVAALVRYASAVADLEATTGWPLAETSEPDPSRPVPEIRK